MSSNPKRGRPRPPRATPKAESTRGTGSRRGKEDRAARPRKTEGWTPRPRKAEARATARPRKIEGWAPRPRKAEERPSRPAPTLPQAEGVRLQKVLAAAGVASRRASEELIQAGRVRVDGRIESTLGTRVDPARAAIEVDGRRIWLRTDHEYLIINKPAGVITTASDPLGRPTVLDLVSSKRRLFPVGRLDADTTGVLLLTDDGELAHRLAHPRYRIEKTYVAKVAGRPEPSACRQLIEGVRLEDGTARATRARVRTSSRAGSTVEIVLTEGRKREVRRMLEEVGHPVKELVRISFGPIKLTGLKPGAIRKLTPGEVGDLYKLVGL